MFRCSNGLGHPYDEKLILLEFLGSSTHIEGKQNIVSTLPFEYIFGHVNARILLWDGLDENPGSYKQ